MVPVSIDSLPPEILGEIFRLVLETYFRKAGALRHPTDSQTWHQTGSSENITTTPVSLLLICKKWHAAASSNSALWLRVTVDYSRRFSLEERTGLEAWVRRCRNMPVQLFLYGRDTTNGEHVEDEGEDSIRRYMQRQIIDICLSTLSQCQSFIMIATNCQWISDIISSISNHDGGLPLVEELSIRIREPTSQPTLTIDFDLLPRLRKVDLFGVDLHPLGSSQTLEEFMAYEECIYGEDLARLLESKSLQACNVGVKPNFFRDDESPTAVELQERNQLTPECPRLSALALGSGDWRLSEAQLFCNMRLPSLQSLALDESFVSRPDICHELISMLQRSGASLAYLELAIGNDQVDVLAQFLLASPNLVSLLIDQTYSDLDLTEEPIWNMLRLFQTADDGDVGPTCFCSHLASLEIRTRQFQETTIAVAEAEELASTIISRNTTDASGEHYVCLPLKYITVGCGEDFSATFKQHLENYPGIDECMHNGLEVTMGPGLDDG